MTTKKTKKLYSVGKSERAAIKREWVGFLKHLRKATLKDARKKGYRG